MKRFALFFASLLLSTVIIGCAEQSSAPAGSIGTGTPSGPTTAGEAKRAREKMFEDMKKAGPKNAAR